jgi:hypothetical protein
MTQDDNIDVTIKSRKVEIDLDQMRPDVEKSANERRKVGLVYAGLLSISLGLVGYTSTHLIGNSQGLKIPPAAAGTVGAVIGAILGSLMGVKHKSYEEQVYNLMENATQSSNSSKGLQEALVKELRNRDAMVATASMQPID